MKTIGIVTTALVALVGLGVVAVGIRSIPDVQRYLRIRAM